MIHAGNRNARALPVPTKARGTSAPLQPILRKPIQHGTVAGYQRHAEIGTTPCDKCRAAAARANEPAKPQPVLSPIVHGTPRGHWLHRRRNEKPCADCRAAYNATRRTGPAPKTRAWDLDAACRDFDNGMTVAQVAEAHGVKPETMRRALAETGRRQSRYVTPPWLDRARELYEGGTSLLDVSHEVGVKGAKTIGRHLRKAGVTIRPRNVTQTGRRAMTAEQMEQLATDYRAGVRMPELTERYGLSDSTLYAYLTRAGVEMRHRGARRQTKGKAA